MFSICLLYVFSYVCAYTSTCLYNASICLITRNGRLPVKFDVFWSFLGDYDKELTNHPFRHFKYFRFQFQNQPNSKKQRKLSKFSNKLEETRHLGEFLIKSTHPVSCSRFSIENLTSLGMGWTNIHPDFQNSSKSYFTSIPSD